MGTEEYPTSLLPEILPDIDGKVVPAYTPLEEYAIIESWEDGIGDAPDILNKWHSIYHKKEESIYHPESISGDEITIAGETDLDIEVGDKARLEYIYDNSTVIVDILKITDVQEAGSDTTITVDRGLDHHNIKFPVLHVYPRDPAIKSHVITGHQVKSYRENVITSGLILDNAEYADYDISDTVFIYNTETGWIYEIADVENRSGTIVIFVYGNLMPEIKSGCKVANITNIQAQHGIKYMDQVLLPYYDGINQVNAIFDISTGIYLHKGLPTPEGHPTKVELLEPGEAYEEIWSERTGIKLGEMPYRADAKVPYNAFLMQCRNRETVSGDLDWIIYFIRGIRNTNVQNKYKGTQLIEYGNQFLELCKRTIREFVRAIAPASYEVDYAYYHGQEKDETGTDELSALYGRPYGGTKTINFIRTLDPTTTAAPTTTPMPYTTTTEEPYTSKLP